MEQKSRPADRRRGRPTRRDTSPPGVKPPGGALPPAGPFPRAPRHSRLPRPFRSGWLRFSPAWLVEEHGLGALDVPGWPEAFRELARLAQGEEALSPWARDELDGIFRALTGKRRKNRPAPDQKALLERAEALERMSGDDYLTSQWGGGFAPLIADTARPLGRRAALEIVAHEAGLPLSRTEKLVSEARVSVGRRLRRRRER